MEKKMYAKQLIFARCAGDVHDCISGSHSTVKIVSESRIISFLYSPLFYIWLELAYNLTQNQAKMDTCSMKSIEGGLLNGKKTESKLYIKDFEIILKEIFKLILTKPRTI